MKNFTIYCLNMKDGRQIAVRANNRIEAFAQMSFKFPVETKGFTYRDIVTC